MYCQDESGDDISCDGSIEEIYEHWMAEHSTVSNTKWFQFYACKTLQCNFCSETGTFHALKVHAKKHAETEIPVVVAKRRHRQCGLCSFVGFEMIEHFESSHRPALQCNIFNPARMSVDLIRALRSIDIHEKRKCGHCAKIFEHDHELQSHHDDKHFPLELLSEKYYDGVSAFAVCAECKLNIERREFFRHLRSHELDFKCSMCAFECRNLLDIVTHDKKIHGMNSFNFHSSKFIDRLRKCQLSSKIVFGNGFVLNNVNLVGTKYDESMDFVDYIEEFIQMQKEQYDNTEA